MKQQLLAAVEDAKRVLRTVRASELKAFKQAILDSQRIFVTGLGRTGLMARGFAMRLMHLGRRVYHVGDVITPAIRQGDLLVICSRTGRSPVPTRYVFVPGPVNGPGLRPRTTTTREDQRSTSAAVVPYIESRITPGEYPKGRGRGP